MFTFISSRITLEAIQNSSISTSYFSDTTWKYAKVVAIALSIFGALATLFSIYYCHNFKATAEDNDPVIPPHISPTSGKTTHSSPKRGDGKPKKSDPDPKKPDLASSSSKQQELDDLKLAQQLQKQEDLKGDLNFGSDEDSEDDAEIAKKLQTQYDAEIAKLPESPAEQKKPSPIVPVLKLPPRSDSLTPPDVDVSPKTPRKPLEVGQQAVVKNPTSVAVDSPKKTSKPLQPSPFNQIEEICAEISEKAFTDPTFSAVKALKGIDQKTRTEVLELLNEIITEFEKRHIVSRIVRYGDHVPAYFANVIEQSDHDRKYLSLVGIRNLLLVGASIIDDFRDTKFLGGEHHYGLNKGLKSFKLYTGNVVDLDTEIEAKSDDEAQKIAREMIVKFGQICGLKKPGLSAENVATSLPHRKLYLNHFVPESLSNTDRSNYGLWKRLTPGEKLFITSTFPTAISFF